MRRVATGLLLAAVVLYVVARSLESPGDGWSYVRATAEAAMVGAIADWFAVTALFRHPLGLPIPHTAIIPRRKDAIGASLGTFVEENFLSRETISNRIATAAPSRRLGEWLANPAHVDDLTDRLCRISAQAINQFDDDRLQAAIDDVIAARLRDLDHATGLAQLTDVITEGRHHDVLVDAAARVTIDFLVDQRAALRTMLGGESPWWVPSILDDAVFDRLHTAGLSFVSDVRRQRSHPARAALDRQLARLATRLRHDERLRAKVHDGAVGIIDHPNVRAFATNLAKDLRRLAVDELSTPGSPTRQTVQRIIGDLGADLRTDGELAERMDAWLTRTAAGAAEIAGPEFASIIETTVERWDGQDTADRIEEQVGRDLQFIRINGTLVGGLIGFTIHLVGETLLH